jgi:diguanylate cyclase (GGDEF)-like protein/PAS domain S-box-containing protein
MDLMTDVMDRPAVVTAEPLHPEPPRPEPLATAAPDPAALYRALLDSHPEPTFSLGPDGRVIECNRAFARFVGRPIAALVGAEFPSLVIGADRGVDACARVAAGVAQSWQAEFVGPDDTVSVGYVTLAPVVVDGRVVGAQGIARDVTVYQVIEEQLQARVLTDPLTGLASRTQLHESIERATRRAHHDPASVAVLFLDLDDFKLVNDGLGHAAGDALLGAVTQRLRRATRGADLVARLGGDEFAVLLVGLATPADALLVVERVHAALRAPVEVDGRPVESSASIGVAHWDGMALPAELVRNANLAMSRAKSIGKARHAVYDAEMQSAARDRLELASDLREAIRAGAIVAAFQPIVDLESGRVLKAEALARWSHPTRGPISPAVFIPLAEETGLVDDLGALMLRQGCAQLRAWQEATDATDAPVGVTVNVSGRQIDRGTLVPAVRDALAESGADARGLTLELTESVAMRQPERLLEILSELAAMGVALAIDDFGTGYSSLSYLHRFPVDVLKIDKSFVDGVASDESAHAQTLIRTIVSVAAALGLQTVAEGIETPAQRDALRALGCHHGQGYLFGRPGPGAAIDATR